MVQNMEKLPVLQSHLFLVVVFSLAIQHAEPLSSVSYLVKRNVNSGIAAGIGSNVTLTCRKQDELPSQVKWYKRVTDAKGKTTNKNVGEGNTFTFKAVSKSDEGEYICVARRKTKLIVSDGPPIIYASGTTTQLIPPGPVKPHLYHFEKTVEARRGRNAYFGCVGIGDPTPKIDWKFNGKKLQNDYKYDIKLISKGDHRVLLKLEIRSVLSNDFGKYHCVASNRLGLEEIHFTLSDKGPLP